MPFPVALAVSVVAAGAPAASAWTLDNGLRVEVSPQPHEAQVSVQVRYATGAKDDPIGRSGLAHLLEHLMFRGTRHLRTGDVHRLLMAAGAADIWGFTSWDETRYGSRLPADQLELAFWVLSSQMGFFLDQPDLAGALAAERPVVLEERAGHMDEATSGLRELVAARLLYPAGHPYQRLVNGNERELERVTVDDVRSFYLRHYRPENAVLSVRGGVSRDQVRALAARYFGPLPRRPAGTTPAIPALVPGERRATIEAPLPLPQVLMVWSVPRGRDGAFHALASLLGSRITRSVSLHSSTSFHYGDRALGGELRGELELLSSRDTEAAERLVHDTLAGLARERITATELDRERSWVQMLLQEPVKEGGAAQRASPLTADAIQEAARSLQAAPRAVVTIVPHATAPRAGRLLQSISEWDDGPSEPRAPDPPVPPDAPFRHQPPAPDARRAPRSVVSELAPLPGGLPMVQLRDGDGDHLTLELLFRIPETGLTPADEAAARLVGHMTWQRTDRRSQQERWSVMVRLEAWLEEVEEPGLVGFRLSVSRAAAAQALPLFAELADGPRFDEPNLAEAKDALATQARQRLVAPQQALQTLLPRLSRGEWFDTRSEVARFRALSLDDVRAIHRRLFHPGNALLIVTTGLPRAELRTTLARAFRASPGAPGAVAASASGPAPGTVAARFLLVDRPDSSRALVAWRFPTPGWSGGDHPALHLLAETLAGGLNSRLGKLRNRAGWLYGFSSWLRLGARGGSLVITAEVSPGRVADLVNAVRREVTDLADRPLPDDELTALRTGRARAWEAGLADPSTALRLVRETWRAGLPIGELAHYAAGIRQVSAVTLRQVAASHLDPRAASVLVLAPRAQLAPELQSAMSEVWVWDRELGLAPAPRTP